MAYQPYYNQFYGYQQPQYQPQPIQQPMQMMPRLQGKCVENIDVVKAMDIPLDGSISYFPIADGSAIVTKQLQMDGTSKTIVYVPMKAVEKEEKQEQITVNDFDELFKKYDYSDKFEDLKDEIEKLKETLKSEKTKK